jgi:hypothetical protein
MKLHKLFFYIFIFLIPLQTRLLYVPQSAYIDWYFNYHLAIFLYFTDIILIISLLSWLISDPPEFNIKWFNTRYYAILGVFLVILASMLHVKPSSLSLYETVKLLEFICIIVYMLKTFKRRDIIVSLALLSIGGFSQAILGWFQFHVQHMIGLKWLGEYIAPAGTAGLANFLTVNGKTIRSYGTFPHPNVLGGYLLSTVIATLYFVPRATKSYAAGCIAILLGAEILGILTTFSRVAWICLVLTLLSYSIFYLWNINYKAALIVLISIIVSCGTFLSFYSDSFRARTSNVNQVSVNDRVYFNNLAIEMIKKYPLVGTGVGNYIPVLINTYDLNAWQYQPPHNIFLFLAAEFGLIGFVVILYLLKQLLFVFRKIVFDDLVFTLYLMILIILLMGQFDHYFVTIQQGRLLFAIVLGLIAALPNIYDYQKSN